jgi:hypothetical protein
LSILRVAERLTDVTGLSTLTKEENMKFHCLVYHEGKSIRHIVEPANEMRDCLRLRRRRDGTLESKEVMRDDRLL